MIQVSVHSAVERITRGTAQVIGKQELEEKLKAGVCLKVKLGADPTAPDLHLGHAVVLEKLRDFQELGHEIIFLIGDFTARIGDPTGKSKTRPPLSVSQIAQNTATYFEQVKKILKPERLSIRYNAEWLQHISMQQVIELCACVTVAQLIEREDFKKRLEAHQAISFHELLYPLLQGYDSVVLQADVEVGGTDQTFNLLMGRELQQQYGQPPQIVITMPLLEGLDGVQKMSKSLNNYVGLAEPAEQAFGKLMSISDALMWRYFHILLHVQPAELEKMQQDIVQNKAHPMVLKKSMAHGIIKKYWSPEEADAAQAQFEALFQQRDYSQAKTVSLPANTPNPLWIVDLLKLLGAVPSSSEARRLLQDGAVRIDDMVHQDFQEKILWQAGMTIRVGKHRIYCLAEQ